MDQSLIWILAIVALVAVAASVWLTARKGRSEQLRQRFGPEYHETVRQTGDPKKAEAELAARARRVERLNIRPLTPAESARFGDHWRMVQAQFVDDPKRSVTAADLLVGEVMTARGYPVAEFEQRVADISVDHPGVVMNYRAAREVAELHSTGEATTEDLRQAMVHYRALFRDLLETGEAPTLEPRDEQDVRDTSHARSH